MSALTSLSKLLYILVLCDPGVVKGLDLLKNHTSGAAVSIQYGYMSSARIDVIGVVMSDPSFTHLLYHKDIFQTTCFFRNMCFLEICVLSCKFNFTLKSLISLFIVTPKYLFTYFTENKINYVMITV